MAKKNNSRIQSPKGNKGKTGNAHILVNSSPNYDQMPPLFSLERIQQTGYCLSDLGKDGRAAFADAIFKRREIPWSEIKKIRQACARV